MTEGDPFFFRLEEKPADGLLALMLASRADTRAEKIDLGLGVYRDPAGNTPVMRAVKEAERQLLLSQQTKVYLGADGDIVYLEALARIAFGTERAADPRLTGMQTPGGTGALRLAAELLKASRADATVWMGDPTWASHEPIFKAAGVSVRWHPLLDRNTGTADVDAMLTALDEAGPGDAVLLHGCCHNPTGIDFSADEWQRITALIVRKQLLPIIDLAYQGLGRGLQEDATGTRLLFDAAAAAIITYSCDKNFGLYRERTGALWVRCPDTESCVRIHAAMRNPARTSWAMPPDHGAAVVRFILASAELTGQWREELDGMRLHIKGLRAALARAHPRLAPLAHQTGMFAMLPLDRDAIHALRMEKAIYLADDGRISIAGLPGHRIDDFMSALMQYL